MMLIHQSFRKIISSSQIREDNIDGKIWLVHLSAAIYIFIIYFSPKLPIIFYSITVSAAVLRNNPEATESIIFAIRANCLKYAPERAGGGGRRK